MPVLIQFRRDTAANWTAANTTLAQGEMGIETDTNLFKIGNGSTAWNSLAYGGIQGIQGVQGTTGIQGVQGLQGAIGAQGTTGDTGVQGLTGSTGAQGTTGAQGIQGTQGLQGTDANVQGIQGIQGADGAAGATGSQGVQGITGNQGIQGIQGADGAAGATGSQGIQGITGNQGIQGIQGLGFSTTITSYIETVYAIGNSGANTLTPDAANGTIQTITATGNFTLNAFANPQSGQTITFIITQDATGSRTLTSSMLFASASKTLSTAANSVDILTVSYVGTTYYASLSKGFA